MGITKKTMILSNDQFDHKSMLTLTLEKKGKEWWGTIKSYYLEDRHAEYLLGIACQDKQMCIVPVCFQGGSMASIRTLANIDLQKKITCVLVTKDEKKPVVWGSTEKLDDTRMSLLSSMQKEEQAQKIEKVESSIHRIDRLQDQQEQVLSNSIPMENETSLDTIETSHVEKIEEVSAESTEMIEKVEDPISLFQPLEEKELDTVIDTAMEKEGKLDMFAQEMAKLDGSQDTFYEQIKDQIEEVFEQNEHETTLETLIPNSQWVLVDQVDGSGQYVLGLLYQDQTLQYIAYGVQGEKNLLPPEEFRAYSQFILTSDSEADGEYGYWVMYQDAITGDNCRIEEDVA